MGAKGYSTYFKTLRALPKENLLSITFDDEENPDRKEVLKIFKDKSFCSHWRKFLPFKTYLRELASYKFALSPRGWGPDAYRTWEALLVGTIPIVKRGEFDVMACAKKYLRSSSLNCFSDTIHAQMDKLYENLPIVVVNDWNEVTEEFLHKKYEEITTRKYDLGLLYMEYWRTKISDVRDDFLRNHVSEHSLKRVKG